jgi:hypothetical protein
MPGSMESTIKNYSKNLKKTAAGVEIGYQGTQATNTAAEKTKLSLLGSLGADGTYGPQDDPYGANSPFTKTAGGMQIFDPEKSGTSVLDDKAGDKFELTNLLGLGKKGKKASKKGKKLGVDYVESRMKKQGLNPTDYDPALIKEIGDNPSLVGGGNGRVNRNNRQLVQNVKENLVNPTKYSEAFFNTSMGRTASMQQAMAEQLVNQSGPLYEKIHRQITAPIHDGAVQLGRESLNVLRQMIGRGGSARRAGLREAMELSNALDVRTQLSDAMKESELQLFNTSNAFAQQVSAFNVNLVESLPMISRDYQNSLQALNEFYTSSVVPAVSALRASAFKAKMQLEQAKMRKRLAMTQIATGIASSGLDSFGGLAGSNAMGGLAGGGLSGASGTSGMTGASNMAGSGGGGTGGLGSTSGMA